MPAVTAGGRHHLHAVLAIRGRGLLHEYIFTGAHSDERHGGMQSAGSGDGHGIDIGTPRAHLFKSGVRLHSGVLSGESLGTLDVYVKKARQTAQLVEVAQSNLGPSSRSRLHKFWQEHGEWKCHSAKRVLKPKDYGTRSTPNFEK